MARASFGRTSLPPLRPAVSPAMMKTLTANPMMQAQQQMKQPAAPKPPKLPKPSKRRGNPNPFFGE